MRAVFQFRVYGNERVCELQHPQQPDAPGDPRRGGRGGGDGGRCLRLDVPQDLRSIHIGAARDTRGASHFKFARRADASHPAVHYRDAREFASLWRRGLALHPVPSVLGGSSGADEHSVLRSRVVLHGVHRKRGGAPGALCYRALRFCRDRGRDPVHSGVFALRRERHRLGARDPLAALLLFQQLCGKLFVCDPPHGHLCRGGRDPRGARGDLLPPPADGGRGRGRRRSGAAPHFPLGACRRGRARHGAADPQNCIQCRLLCRRERRHSGESSNFAPCHALRRGGRLVRRGGTHAQNAARV